MQLGQADQIPRQLVGLAGGDGRDVRAGQRAREQGQLAMAVRLLQHALREFEVTRFAGGEVQLGGRVHQHRRRQAVMVAQFGDVDAAIGQRVPAQVADPARGFEVVRRGEMSLHFEQAEDQVGVRPDVPGAHAGRAVPAGRLRRLRAHEAVIRRVGAEVAVGLLDRHQVVGDAQHARAQRRIAAARGRLRRGDQPLAGVLAVPVALAVLVAPLGREQRDRGAVFIDDEMREPAAQVGGQRLAEQAAELHAGRRCFAHAASTTQRKPTLPERSLHGAISRYLPCWSSRYACGKYQCEVCGW